MSYSIRVKGASKAEAKANFTEAFDRDVVQNQPTHKVDRDAQIAHAHNLIDLVREPEEGNELVIDANGSVGWRGDSSCTPLEVWSAAGNVSVYHLAIPAA